MNLFSYFLDVVREAVRAVASEQGVAAPDLSRLTAEPPRDKAHGDIASNAAMVLTKSFGKNPRQLAELIAAKLRGHEDIAAVEIAGPGFINIRLKSSFWPRVLESALKLGNDYGRSDMGAGLKANVEYVSANPTGPLHVGHCRGAVFGDALAELLKVTGFEVTKEYYINDAGAQVDVVARSAFLRYREALGEDIGDIPAGLYPGDYLKPVGVALAKKHGRALLDVGEQVWLPIIRTMAMAMMMDLIRDDLASLNIKQEIFFSEKSLHESGEVRDAVADLRKAGHVYEGRLPPPKGEAPEDWEDREQTLFRATAFGDDIDQIGADPRLLGQLA